MKKLSVTEHQIKIKDLNIYYRTAGELSDPPVILLNGWGARVRGQILSSEIVIKEFARRNFYVISPEHPGLMRSETPKFLWGPGEYAGYLEEFIVKLGVKKFVLVGQSFGGAIATLYIANHPKEIKTLVLVSSGLTRDKIGFMLRYFSLSSYLSFLLRSKIAPVFLKKIVVWASLGVPLSHIRKEAFERRAIMGDIFRKWSLPDVYSKIDVRTILVWGKNDWLFPLDKAKEVAKTLPSSELIVVRGGHSVLYTKPKKIINLICEKLAEN